jgi:hypothetical protein
VFRCQVCRKVVAPNTRPIRHVVETRERQYPLRLKANRFKRDGRERRSDDPGGTGREIVREVLICGACAEAFAVKDRTLSRLRGPPDQAIAA